VKEWQRNAIRHLIAQRDTLDNDIWQMNNRRNNLAEMEQEAQKKHSEPDYREYPPKFSKTLRNPCLLSSG
jgi:hypothetical protein